VALLNEQRIIATEIEGQPQDGELGRGTTPRIVAHSTTQFVAKCKIKKQRRGEKLVELIETSGLDYLDRKSVALDDPIGKKMQLIIFSEEGKRAACEATEQGLPALAGLDPLLARALGRDYGPHNEATVQAGYLVTNMMRQLGYRDAGQGQLPSGCVARSGRIFVPSSSA
jgi:hypothetical protein